MITLNSRPDEIIKEGFETFGTYASPEIQNITKDEINQIKTYDGYVELLKQKANVSEDEAQTIAGGVLYGILEKLGINPKEWQLVVKPIDRGNVKYGVEEYEEARKFLGSWTRIAEIALLVASIAGIATTGIGVFLSSSALKLVLTAIRSGAGISAIGTLFNIIKLKGIKWLSVPAFVATLGSAWAFFANTQITANGDLETYVKQGVARAEQTTANLGGSGSNYGGTGNASFTPTPRLYQTTKKKPSVFVGTIMSGRIEGVAPFVRQLDDKITDVDDLLNDAKINLTKWLKSFPARLTYELQIKFEPFDEYNVRKTGYWVSLDLYHSSKFGNREILDSILLGPIDSVDYFEIDSITRQVQVNLPAELLPADLTELTDADGVIEATTKGGQTVNIFNPTPAPQIPSSQPDQSAGGGGSASAPAVEVTPTPTPAPATPTPTSYNTENETLEEKLARFEREGNFKVTRTGIARGCYMLAGNIICDNPIIIELLDKIDAKNGSQSFPVTLDTTNNQKITIVPKVAQASSEMRFGSGKTQYSYSVDGKRFIFFVPGRVKVVVPALYVRSKPDTYAPTAGSVLLHEGDEFEITEVVLAQNVDDIPFWVKSSKGNYVWAGGLSFI